MAAAEFAVRLLKALFLVKYVKEFKPTLRNLSVLMLDRFDQDIPALRKMSKKVIKDVRPLVTEYQLGRNKSIHLLADGRLVNLSAATGHPASVMDMSFATQALTAEWIVKKGRKLGVAVHEVPKAIEEQVAKLKLQAMGISIDRLTREQVHYLSSSGEGT